MCKILHKKYGWYTHWIFCPNNFRIFFFGGRNEEHKLLNDFYYLDLRSMTWVKVHILHFKKLVYKIDSTWICILIIVETNNTHKCDYEIEQPFSWCGIANCGWGHTDSSRRGIHGGCRTKNSCFWRSGPSTTIQWHVHIGNYGRLS